MRRWLTTPLLDESQAERWLADQAIGSRFSFAVVANGSVCGHVAVTPRDGGVAEVGYWTAAHARGRGVAAYALETVSQWALERVTRLDLFHTVGNEASCRVAVKCGYVLRDLLPAAPPAFPALGHRHCRSVSSPADGDSRPDQPAASSRTRSAGSR